MRTRVGKSIRVAMLGAVAAVLVAVVVVAGAGTASASPSVPSPRHAQTIVNHYLGILNKGMKSSSCDFSALSWVYTSDARLTLTGGPFVPSGTFGEQQVDGIHSIIGFYTNFCRNLKQHVGNVQWTQDAAFLLAPNVLNSYEHTSVSGTFLGRCMHVFTIRGNRISSLDWTVYS